MHQKVVITGGPGTGKSTVIAALETQFTCMPEVSRSVTRDAQSRGIDQLFLHDPLIFSELLLKERINQYELAEEFADQTIFFDQSLLIFEKLKSTYYALGYPFEIIPEASVENRIEFILNAIES